MTIHSESNKSAQQKETITPNTRSMQGFGYILE